MMRNMFLAKWFPAPRRGAGRTLVSWMDITKFPVGTSAYSRVLSIPRSGVRNPWLYGYVPKGL